MRRIVTDSRESLPYSFPRSIRKALPAGDYSLDGMTDRVVIERKSTADLISTVVHNRRRFTAELTKLQSYEYAAVVVEGSISDILSGDYRSEIAPKALLGIVCGLMLRFPNVKWLFCDDRPHAYAVVREILKLKGGDILGNRDEAA